jgi:Tfp pilus assembly protein PilP
MTETTNTPEKAKNYTPEMVATMLDTYSPEASQDERDAQVNQLVVDLGRSKRSIVAKLSSLKVYVPKEYKTKQGAKPVSKAALVSVVASVCGADEDVFDSLEKANKNVIERIIARFASYEDEIAFLEGGTETVEGS